METTEEQMIRHKQNVVNLKEMSTEAIESAGVRFTGILVGTNNPLSGPGMLFEVSNKEKTDKVLVVAEVKMALLAMPEHEYAEMRIGDEVAFEGIIVEQMLMKDLPWVSFIAFFMQATGNNVKGQKPQNFDITMSNITDAYKNRAGDRQNEEAIKLYPLGDDLFAGMRKINPEIKGVICFYVKNNGDLAMLVKGDLFAKEVKRIGNKLMEYTKKQNPDYLWHGE